MLKFALLRAPEDDERASLGRKYGADAVAIHDGGSKEATPQDRRRKPHVDPGDGTQVSKAVVKCVVG